jgi:hypothetical protein
MDHSHPHLQYLHISNPSAQEQEVTGTTLVQLVGFHRARRGFHNGGDRRSAPKMNRSAVDSTSMSNVSFVVVLFLLSAALLFGTASLKSNGIARTADHLDHDVSLPQHRRLRTDQVEVKNNEEFLQKTRHTHLS